MADSPTSGTDSLSPSEMLPAERRRRLVAWFETNAAGSSQDLARMFGTSVSTIRRDLDLLAGEGLVRRTHGGAVRIRRHATYEPSTDLARRTAVEERRAIVFEALSLIEPEQSLLIDTGATCHELATALAGTEMPLTVITNDLFVAHSLTYRENIRLIVPGGLNREGAYSLIGEPALSFLGDVRCDLYFMSAQAVDPDCASDTTMDLVLLKRAMIAAAARTVLLADSSRFSARAIYRIAPLDRIDTLITDEGLPEEERERYRGLGLILVCARP